MKVDAIVTAPPYASFLEEVAGHRLVSGLRLNTVMPLKESKAEVLRRMARLGPPLWIDLKGRQLRVVGAAVPPYTEVRLSHRIEVDTPVNVYFSDGRERVRAVAADGDRLILEDGPRRLVGPGESVNIPHPSLRVEGTLTETDEQYLEAMAEVGLRKVMLSYAERAEDVDEVRALLPDAEVMLKIESRRGLDLAARRGAELGRLVAARGDLYVEVDRPHRIVSALRQVVAADSRAVVASRLFESLVDHPVPESADVSDAAFLMGLGYRTFLLGDLLCFDRETLLEALALLAAVASEHP